MSTLNTTLFEQGISSDELAALCGRDLALYTSAMFPKFRPARHHHRICDVLNDVVAGKKKRVILTMPPRHGKSLLASQHLPAYYLGNHPDREVICATYSQDKADDWGREVRNQVGDPTYGAIFPNVTLRKDSASGRRFKTPQMGSYFAAGRNSPITGRGASLLIVDDIIKGDEEADSPRIREKVKNWWGSVAYTRLTPSGAVVMIGTRWHDDDLIGFVLREHADEDWEVIDFPAVNSLGEALWPEFFPLEHLRRIRRALSERHWTALYQQRPFSEEGAIIKRGWWRAFTGELANLRVDFIVISFDTAYEEKTQADRSACTVWWVYSGADFRQRILLRYAWAEQLDFPNLLAKATDTITHFSRGAVPVHVLIEGKASGKSLRQEMRRRKPDWSIHEVPATEDKFARAYSVQTLLEHGSVEAIARMEKRKNLPVERRVSSTGEIVWVSPPDEAEPVFRPWAQEVIDECAQFPRGRHDDYLDSATHALRWIRDRGVELFAEDEPAAPPVDGSQTAKQAALY